MHIQFYFMLVHWSLTAHACARNAIIKLMQPSNHKYGAFISEKNVISTTDTQHVITHHFRRIYRHAAKSGLQNDNRDSI